MQFQPADRDSSRIIPSPRDLVAIIIAAVIAMLANVASANTFVIPWGPAEHELGLTSATEMERQGPLTFLASPSGTIIVADTVKRRIVEFSAAGRFETVVRQNVVPNALALDDKQRLLMLQGQSVDRRNDDGQWTPVLIISPDVPVVEGYGQDLFVEDGYIAINDPDGQALLFTPFGNGRPVAVLAGRTFGGTSRAWIGANQGRLAPTAVRPQTLRPARGIASEAVLLRGVRKTDNAYLVERHHFLTPQPRAEMEIVSATGAAQPVAVSKGLDFTTTYRRFDIAPSGDVWAMRTTPQGVEFTKWQVQP